MGQERKPVFGIETGKRHNDTRQQAQKIHEIEDAKLSFFVAAKRGLVPDIPDISPETENTFYSLIHGQSLV
jgi:hypothetical protein